MEQSSIIIHKGKKEEKYEVYIEDYVMSFLKDETGTLELSELYFYGIRQDTGRRYIIYGAGKEKNLSAFDKYSLLDEVGCRLTQAGPVFLVKEKNSMYEIKGYKIFYQDNREMQNYLIESNAEINQIHEMPKTVRGADMPEKSTGRVSQNKASFSAISVQLGIILIALVAIVINSANSYDKMNQLNQSAVEVLFAIENQEAGSGEAVDNSEQDDTLNLALLGNDEQAQEISDEEAAETAETKTENTAEDDTAKTDNTVTEETTTDEAEQQNDAPPEEIEALSRNVTRYYEVEKGDTLYTISKKFYGDITHVQRICELNQIANPDNIRYGQKIVLP